MRLGNWVCVGSLLLLIGCKGFLVNTESEDSHPRAIPDNGPLEETKRAIVEEYKKHPERFRTVKEANLISKVQDRLPSLKSGMTEAEVKNLLSDLPLGEEVIASRTISGGKTVQYPLTSTQSLELTFIPQTLHEPRPGRLTKAQLIAH